MSESTSSTSTGPAAANAIEAAANAVTGNGPTEAAKPSESATAADEALGDGGKRALVAERERATNAERQAAEFKAKLDKIEAANLSDLERAQKQAQESAADAAKARIDVLRFRVAAQHGISEEDAELFLTGADADTLTKQATRLKERTTTTPKPDLSQGAQHAAALNGDGLTEALSRAVGAR